MGVQRTITRGALALLLLAPTAVAFFSGGYFDVPRLVLSLGMWSLVIVAAVASPRALPTSGAGRMALSGMLALTALTAASIAWAPLSSAAIDDTQRLLAYLAALVAGVALLNTRGRLSAIEPALAAGAFVVIAYGLSERLLPGLVELERSVNASGRLDQPLTYWNAMGALAAIGLVLCARLAGDATRATRVRGAAAFVAPVLGLGLFLSLSRGAIAACAAGLAILVLLAPSRPQLRAVLICAALSVAVSAAALPLPWVRSLDAAADARGVAGLAMLVVLVGAGALGAFLATRSSSEPTVAGLDARRLRGARAAAGAMLAACLIGGALATVIVSERRTMSGPESGSGAERLRSVESNRSAYWGVAIATFADHPIAGVGTGGFRVEWLRERSFEEPAEDAHSLYVETAAELGLAGLAALVLLIAGVGIGGRVALARDPQLAAGPLAGLSVFAIHCGLDWDWEMPAVGLTGIVLAAAVVAASERGVSAPRAG